MFFRKYFLIILASIFAIFIIIRYKNSLFYSEDYVNEIQDLSAKYDVFFQQEVDNLYDEYRKNLLKLNQDDLVFPLNITQEDILSLDSRSLKIIEEMSKINPRKVLEDTKKYTIEARKIVTDIVYDIWYKKSKNIITIGKSLILLEEELFLTQASLFDKYITTYPILSLEYILENFSLIGNQIILDKCIKNVLQNNHDKFLKIISQQEKNIYFNCLKYYLKHQILRQPDKVFDVLDKVYLDSDLRRKLFQEAYLILANNNFKDALSYLFNRYVDIDFIISNIASKEEKSLFYKGFISYDVYKYFFAENKIDDLISYVRDNQSTDLLFHLINIISFVDYNKALLLLEKNTKKNLYPFYNNFLTQLIINNYNKALKFINNNRIILSREICQKLGWYAFKNKRKDLTNIINDFQDNQKVCFLVGYLYAAKFNKSKLNNFLTQFSKSSFFLNLKQRAYATSSLYHFKEFKNDLIKIEENKEALLIAAKAYGRNDNLNSCKDFYKKITNEKSKSILLSVIVYHFLMNKKYLISNNFASVYNWIKEQDTLAKTRAIKSMAIVCKTKSLNDFKIKDFTSVMDQEDKKIFLNTLKQGN